MDAPKGLILFSKTPVSVNENTSNRTQSTVISILFIVSLIVSYWVVEILIFTTILLVTNIMILIKLREITSIPVAVNFNHPFMDSEPMAKSEVMVKFTDKWIDPGINRLKLAKDPINGWILHKQDSEISFLSVWDTKSGEKLLLKQLAIINQAISLNNAVNESKDEFEDARDRESQDSDLLEREWMPEDEFEVQGPISRIFSPK